MYLLSHSSFFCALPSLLLLLLVLYIATNTLKQTFSFSLHLSMDFHSTVIRLFCAICTLYPFSFPLGLILSPFFSQHFWMNISKIYTLTNNDCMNSNVKTPHCSHHSSPTKWRTKGEKTWTIPKTDETLTISLCVIAWVRLNEFIFSCNMPFFVVLFQSALSLNCTGCALSLSAF